MIAFLQNTWIKSITMPDLYLCYLCALLILLAGVMFCSEGSFNSQCWIISVLVLSDCIRLFSPVLSSGLEELGKGKVKGNSQKMLTSALCQKHFPEPFQTSLSAKWNVLLHQPVLFIICLQDSFLLYFLILSPPPPLSFPSTVFL